MLALIFGKRVGGAAVFEEFVRAEVGVRPGLAWGGQVVSSRVDWFRVRE